MRIKSVEKTSFKSQIYFDNKTKRSWNKHSFWPNFVEMVQKRDETARLEDFLKNKITQNGDDNYLVIEEFKRKRKERSPRSFFLVRSIKTPRWEPIPSSIFCLT